MHPDPKTAGVVPDVIPYAQLFAKRIVGKRIRLPKGLPMRGDIGRNGRQVLEYFP